MGLAPGDVPAAAQDQQVEPQGPWAAGLQGRWDEKLDNGLDELPYSLNFGSPNSSWAGFSVSCLEIEQENGVKW